MTEKIINGIPFSFVRDENYNGLEYCIDYMYKEEDDGTLLIETPNNEENIKAKFEAGWKKLTELKKEGFTIILEREKTTVYNSSSDFTLPVPADVNDFIKVYLISEFKYITVELLRCHNLSWHDITWDAIK